MLRQTRTLIARLVSDLTEEQLFAVPAGYRNNILWNVGHIIVTQQILHYRLSGLPMYVSEDMIISFSKGSSPALWRTAPRFEDLRELLLDLPAQLLRDYTAGKFETFKPYSTSTGPVLNDLEDAIAFNTFHEGVHAGVILSLKKMVI